MSKDYNQSTYNCFNNEIQSIKGNKIDYIKAELKKADTFSEFSMTSEKTKKVTAYSFIVAGEMVKEGLTITQLRRFYNYIKKMQYEMQGGEHQEVQKVKAKLTLLLPKLAGAATKKKEVKPLYEIISACIEKGNLPEKKDILFFIEFLEAVLDYFEALSKELK